MRSSDRRPPEVYSGTEAWEVKAAPVAGSHYNVAGDSLPADAGGESNTGQQRWSGGGSTPTAAGCARFCGNGCAECSRAGTGQEGAPVMVTRDEFNQHDWANGPMVRMVFSYQVSTRGHLTQKQRAGCAQSSHLQSLQESPSAIVV